MNDYPLNKAALKKALQDMDCKADLYFFEETTSTFDEAARLNTKDTALIAAKRQTMGRGRLGRSWQSDKGGIYLSLILKPCVPKEKLQLMTSICAVGVRRAIAQYTECMIKWPNDIVSAEGKKLCGILTRLDSQGDMINVGIGINANNEDFDAELKYASSISLILGRKINENALTASLTAEILKLCSKPDIGKILDEYKAGLINLNKRVRLVYSAGRGEECGLCTDIDDMGALIVTKDDGLAVALGSGEVSVRGVYGEYV